MAEGIRQTDLEVQFDACCKRLLAEKVVVAWIMKWCIPEYREFSMEEIAEKYIVGTPSVGIMPLYPGEKKGYRIHNENTEDASLNEGRVTYDVRFRAMIPGSSEAVEMLINIEGQNDFYPGYSLVKRALYYCCRMISSQYGTEFSRGQYGKLKKVYSIWICMNPPKKREARLHGTGFRKRCGWKSSGEREKLRFTDGGYGVLGDKEERYKRGAWGETVIKNVGSIIFR